MIFTATKLKDVYTIDLDLSEDERGWFARSFCREEFQAHGLNPCVVQCSISFNRHRGTLRGMHYQVAPHAEAKVVRCTAGAIYDVVIDLRPDSPTFKQWIAVDLTSRNRRMVYIPEGCAHGFQTLIDNTEVFYQMSEFYHPESARGVRWNDPAFGIEWPVKELVISERDRTFPFVREEYADITKQKPTEHFRYFLPESFVRDRKRLFCLSTSRTWRSGRFLH